MNKNGQVLVLFVILIPLLILVLTYVIDIGYLQFEKNKLEQISNELFIDIKKNNLSDEEIKSYVALNDSEIIVDIIRNDNQIMIKLNKFIKGAFQFMLNREYYLVKSIKTMEL